MSKSAADRLRARADEIRDREQQPVAEPAPAGERPPPRTRPFRQTVDIPPAQHLALAQWRMETAVQLGRSRLTNQDVLSATISVLLEDESMARKVRIALESKGE